MDKEKFYQCLFFIGGIVLVISVCWWLLREPDIHDQRERATNVTESLDRIGEEQRHVKSDIERIERGLDESIGRTDEIAKRIDDAQSAINASQERRGECESLVEDSERRIAESRAILQRVRSGAQ